MLDMAMTDYCSEMWCGVLRCVVPFLRRGAVLTLLSLCRLGDDELRRLQLGGDGQARLHQHKLLQVGVLLLKLLQLLHIPDTDRQTNRQTDETDRRYCQEIIWRPRKT